MLAGEIYGMFTLLISLKVCIPRKKKKSNSFSCVVKSWAQLKPSLRRGPPVHGGGSEEVFSSTTWLAPPQWILQ